MNPNQNPGVDYNFILNPEKPKRSFNFNAASTTKKIILISAAFIIFVILIIVFKNIFTTPAFSKKDMSAVLVAQSKIINVTANDFDTGKSQLSASSQNSLATISASIVSEQNETISYLKKNNWKINLASVSVVNTSDIDATLKNATDAGTLDPAYKQTMQKMLKDYMAQLAIAYNTTHGQKGKAMLKNDYKYANTMLGLVSN